MARDKKALDGLTFVLDGPRGVEVVAGVPRGARARRRWPAWEHERVARRWHAGRPVVLLLHGPNLNLLGEREPDVYGTATLADHVATRPSRGRRPTASSVEDAADATTRAIWSTPSTRARGRCAAIVINPGAFTHYAWALHDALAAFDGPVVEVHLSNPNAREPWRHTSVVAPVATGSIMGFGGDGYELAIEALARLLGGSP